MVVKAITSGTWKSYSCSCGKKEPTVFVLPARMRGKTKCPDCGVWQRRRPLPAKPKRAEDLAPKPE